MTDISKLRAQRIPGVDLHTPFEAKPTVSRGEIVWSKSFDFGMKDERGRTIGCAAWITKWGPGEFTVRTHVTRDGEHFGAVTKGKRCASVRLAKDEVQRRLTRSVKRYAKKINLLAEGCHARWVDRETGSTLTLRDADDPEAGPYDVVCEDHSTVINVQTKASGRNCTALDFCDDCRERA